MAIKPYLLYDDAFLQQLYSVLQYEGFIFENKFHASLIKWFEKGNYYILYPHHLESHNPGKREILNQFLKLRDN